MSKINAEAIFSLVVATKTSREKTVALDSKINARFKKRLKVAGLIFDLNIFNCNRRSCEFCLPLVKVKEKTIPLFAFFSEQSNRNSISVLSPDEIFNQNHASS